MKYKELLNINYKLAEKYNREKEAINFLIREKNNINNLYLLYDCEVDNLTELQKSIDEYIYQKKPVQYIVGYQYFYGLKLKVSKDVLIPRNDTEILIDEILKLNKDYNFKKIADVGTGSGAIALAIKKNISEALVDAYDISFKALEIAKENSKNLNLNVNFIENDLLLNVKKKYDLIVSNPPYIAKNDYVAEDVLLYEPHIALFSEEDGMYFYRNILEQSLNLLNENGVIAFEIGYNQSTLIEKLKEKYYKDCQGYLVKDYSNNPRVYIIKK